MSKSNNALDKHTENYTHRGAQTPTYPTPPMPKTAPVKPSKSDASNKDTK